MIKKFNLYAFFALLTASNCWANCPDPQDFIKTIASGDSYTSIPSNVSNGGPPITLATVTGTSELSTCISTATNKCSENLEESSSDLLANAELQCAAYCGASTVDEVASECSSIVSELSIIPCGGVSDLVTGTLTFTSSPDSLSELPPPEGEPYTPSPPSSYSNTFNWSSQNPSNTGTLIHANGNINTDPNGNINFVSFSCTSNAYLEYKCTCPVTAAVEPLDPSAGDTTQQPGGGTWTGGGLWPVSAMSGTGLCPPDQIYVLFINQEGGYGSGCYSPGEFPIPPEFKSSGIGNDALLRHLGF